MKLPLKTCLALLLVFLSAQSRAQEANLPIYTTIVSNIKADTARVWRLVSRANRLKNDSPDSATKLLNEALTISNRIGFNDGVGATYLGLGVVQINKGHYDSAEKYLQSAVPYCEKVMFNKTLPVMLYNAIAVLYRMESKNSLSIYFFYKALDEMKASNIQKPHLRSLIYSNLGLVWMREKQYDKATYYLKQGEQIAVDNRVYDNLAKIYVIMSGVYIETKNYTQGRDYAMRGMELSRPYNDSVSQYCALLNIAISYQDSDPVKALVYFKQAFVYSTINPYYSQINPYLGIATAYYNLHDYKPAEKYLLMAYDDATKKKMIEYRRDATKGLASVYEQSKDYNKAYKYQQLYSAISDSITNAKQILANHQLDAKYRTVEKDNELIKRQLLITQQKNLLNNKNIWIGSIAIGGLLVVMLLIGISRSYRHKQQVQAKELQIIKQQQEINELRATIKGEEKERTRLGRELHDGIGGLISAFTISFDALGEENKSLQQTKTYQKALYLLHEMSTEVRKTSHNMMPEVLLHHSLPDAIRHFCDYMQQSKKSDLQIDVQSFGKFDLLDRELMLSSYRIIQELVQNVVKHANATHAVVQLILRDHILNITVEDNGVGFETDVESDGMGLLNLKSRIKSMNGSLVLESFKNRGTSVFIEFDLNKKEITA